MLKTIEDLFYKLLGCTLAFTFVLIACAAESLVDLLLKSIGL